MKNLIIMMVLFTTTSIFAQKPKFDNDTITYSKSKIFVGDTLHLGYGSSNNKDFAFIYIGSGFVGLQALNRSFNKQAVLIDKVYETRGKFYARGIMFETDANLLGSGKLFIDIEGAIDNKEVKED